MYLNPETAFKADCTEWVGYKPCAIQKAQGRPDCFGCEEYTPAADITPAAESSFSPEVFATAENIGIVEMGGLGSVLRTTAVSKAIREVNPNTAITWFTHRRGADLLQYAPNVSAIDVYDTPSETRDELVDNLDALLNFEMANEAKDIVARATAVGGFMINAQGKFVGAAPHAEYFQRLQIDDNFRERNTKTMQEILLESVGLDSEAADYDITLDDTNHQAAEQVLDHTYGSNRPTTIIGMNIGTSEKGKLRRWPAERYAALAQKLSDTHPDAGVVVLSGPDDAETRQTVAAALTDNHPNKIAVLPGNLQVGNFMGVLRKLDVVVSSDTFGMHAARSQDTPTVALAGPMPHRELELSHQDTVIGPQTSCSPCYHRCSQPIESQCMQDISVDIVAHNVNQMLKTP